MQSRAIAVWIAVVAGGCGDGGSGVVAPSAIVASEEPGESAQGEEGVQSDVSVTPALAPLLCRPCASSEDCRTSAKETAGSSCVRYGKEQGAFCGTGCVTSQDCPGGYACKTYPVVETLSRLMDAQTVRVEKFASLMLQERTPKDLTMDDIRRNLETDGETD